MKNQILKTDIETLKCIVQHQFFQKNCKNGSYTIE